MTNHAVSIEHRTSGFGRWRVVCTCGMRTQWCGRAEAERAAALLRGER